MKFFEYPLDCGIRIAFVWDISLLKMQYTGKIIDEKEFCYLKISPTVQRTSPHGKSKTCNFREISPGTCVIWVTYIFVRCNSTKKSWHNGVIKPSVPQKIARWLRWLKFWKYGMAFSSDFYSLLFYFYFLGDNQKSFSFFSIIAVDEKFEKIWKGSDRLLNWWVLCRSNLGLIGRRVYFFRLS